MERKRAEAVRRKLAAAGVLNGAYTPAHDEKFVYFAVVQRTSSLEHVQKNLAKRAVHGKSLAEELSGKLTKREAEELVKSFDIVGDIAVVEIPPSLVAKEKLIASAILKNHSNIKVVAKKTGGTSGEFRIRPVKVIAGEKRTKTVYREAGCDFELDLNGTYFSSRLGTERTRIAGLVKPGEQVLIPFAGVGPFAIRIAKTVPSTKVVGIELNPAAVQYFKQNIARNKCTNVIAIQGDVSKLLPGKYKNWADRIAMPLPKDGHSFLTNAIPCLKKGGVLHYYSFGRTDEPYETAEKEVKLAAKKLGRGITIVFRRIARPFSKTIEQVVVDAKIG